MNEPRRDEMEKIVVYTTRTWPHCITAKEFLSQKGVEYEEKDVQQDAQARKELMERGIMAVPVIAVGDEFIVGFDKTRLEQKLS